MAPGRQPPAVPRVLDQAAPGLHRPYTVYDYTPTRSRAGPHGLVVPAYIHLLYDVEREARVRCVGAERGLHGSALEPTDVARTALFFGA
jgi:hypothetical protein